MGFFTEEIIRWYEINKRSMPWRETKDPYLVWISEIMLQQTRVNQALPFFNRFIAEFPDVFSLSKAKEDRVLRLWQGLGYYSRARNLHFTAKHLVRSFGGSLPENYQEIIALKGIGDYTASAILSISFNKPHPVIDGNVERVLSRYGGISDPVNSPEGKKKIRLLAEKFLDRLDPGTYNQAIMEFGSLQCVPSSPDCRICPLNESCFAFRKEKVDLLPVKLRKVPVKTRYLDFFFISDSKKVMIEKRVKNDIWKNLYQLPMIESAAQLSITRLRRDAAFVKMMGSSDMKLEKLFEMSHPLTHQLLHIRVFSTNPESRRDALFVDRKWVKIDQFDKYAFPKPLEIFFNMLKRG